MSKIKSIKSGGLLAGKRINGQGMTEYIIIVALIAIAAVAAVAYFGSSVQAQFVQLGGEVVGSDPDAAADNVQEVAVEAKGLGNYAD